MWVSPHIHAFRLHSSKACADMCELGVFAQWIHFSLHNWRTLHWGCSEGGELETVTDSTGGALIYSYTLWYLIHMHAYWMPSWTHLLHSRRSLTWKNPRWTDFLFFLNGQNFFFNKLPFYINSRLPTIVLKLWSIQPLIGNYVWLAGISAAKEEEEEGDEGGGNLDSACLSFFHSFNRFSLGLLFYGDLFIGVHAWWIKWLK